MSLNLFIFNRNLNVDVILIENYTQIQGTLGFVSAKFQNDRLDFCALVFKETQFVFCI